MPLFLTSNHKIDDISQKVYIGMHTHNHYELYCFLGSEADYTVEGHLYHLQRGDLILTRKSEIHHLQPGTQTRYERIFLHFDDAAIRDLDPQGRLRSVFRDRPLGQFNHFRASLFPDRMWLYYLEKICACDTPERKRYYLLALLDELAECFPAVKTSEQEMVTDRAAVVMEYINRHLTEELSMDRLAERFSISKTYLNDLFKRAAGTTVWNYIVVKRLFTARERIVAGEAPTGVYADCGFQDYTTFYRAYRQHFGISPREDSPRRRAVKP